MVSLPDLTSSAPVLSSAQVRIMQGFLSEVGREGTEGWLLALLTGKTSLDMPPELDAFISTSIASHMDPYLDGEISSPEEERNTLPLLNQLQT